MAGNATLEFESLAAGPLANAPDSTAIRFGAGTLSYAQLQAAIERNAAALASLGIGQGDRVALMILNRPELLALYFACWRLGAITVPTNVMYRRPEVEYAVDHCEARILIVQDELAEEALGLRDTVPSLERVFSLHEHVPGLDGAWCDAVEAAPAEGPRVALQPEWPASIYYTSGSTDKPKGVVHSHGAGREIVDTRCASMSFGADDSWVVGTSMVHVSGTYGTCFAALALGGSACLLERWSAEAFIEATRQHRPTRALLLPALAHDVLDHPQAASTDFSCFRSLEVGGDAVTTDLNEQWQAATGKPILQILGMTECEGYCLTRPEGPIKQGASGPPRTGVEVQVVDADNNVLPPNQTGQLRLRSASLFSGYWEDPEHTAGAIRDGWLYTNDLGSIDDDGYVWFRGRTSEMIVRRGSNIAPGEVENVLMAHPEVLEAVVVGVKDPKIGQRVAAFVEPEPGFAPTEETLKAFALQRLGEFKVPEFWRFMDALPRNAVGKLDRKAVHELARAQFE